MKLTVVLINTWDCAEHLRHTNETVPFTRRSVQIELTPEQLDKIRPLQVGVDQGFPVYERIGEHWLETEPVRIDYSKLPQPEK